jgi:hypothetical protein
MISKNGPRHRCGTVQNELAAPRSNPAAATFALMLRPAARPAVVENPWLNRISSKQITALRTVTDAENLNSANGAEAIASTPTHAMNVTATRKFLATLSIGWIRVRSIADAQAASTGRLWRRTEPCMIKSTIVMPIARAQML